MKLNMLHKDWLNSQKITNKVLLEFKVHTNDSHQIVFPVYDENHRFIFNKYRRSPDREFGPKYSYDKGGATSLYGWHLAKDHDTILITEGEKDCLVAWSHNIPAVSSTGGALNFPAEWKEMLVGKKLIVCFDNDKAGGEGMAKLYKLFGPEHIKIMFLPDRGGIKDLCDYVAGGGDPGEVMLVDQSRDCGN